MRIVFFTKGDRMLPSSRTRVYLVADYLCTLGHDAKGYRIMMRPWWDISWSRVSDVFRNVRILLSVKKNEVLYLHKATDQLDFMVLVLLRKWLLRRPYIFDFDDAIFLPTWNRDVKCRLMCRYASAVVVGSHFLAGYASKYNNNVHVLSAPIDTDDVYTAAQQKNETDRVIDIGWTGTSGHYDNMKLLLEPLRRLVADGLKIRFVQLGGGERINELMKSVPGLDVSYTESLPWDKPKEVVPHLQTFDIGVMPLQKTEHNRGKDGWKAKEYMGCGVATVLSDWGENSYIVDNEKNGLLVDTAEDWYRALKRLISDPVYRRRIGAAGRAHMEDEYSYAAFAPRFLQIIEGCARGS